MDSVKLIDGEMLSLEEVFEKYRRLLASISSKLLKTAQNFGLEFDDLMGYGSEGLIKAYNRFDDQKGFKFMTYAFPLVKGEMQRRIRDFGGVVKFTRAEKDLAREIYRNELQDSNIAGISEMTGRKESEVISALAILKGPSVSIEKKINDAEDKDLTIADRIGAEDDLSVLYVEDFLTRIPLRLRTVIEMMLSHKTQNEIANTVGCSQVQVSRYLKKIRELYQEYLMGGQEDMAIINADEYLKLKEQGLTDTKIAIKVNTTPNYLSQLKKKWNLQPETAPVVEKKSPMTNKTKEFQVDEYETLIENLREQLKYAYSLSDEKSILIEKLESKIADYENITAACDDVENEVGTLRDEIEKLSKLNIDNDYLIENQKHQIQKSKKEITDLREENTALKFLTRRYLALDIKNEVELSV